MNGVAPQVYVIYTDFRKTFDKVDHNILLAKLDNVDYSEAHVDLFRSYVNGR